MAKDPTSFADHLLKAIANIEADIAEHNLDSFRADRRARQLVERNLEIISEASRRLPDAAKAEESDIPWRAIAGIGNILRHDYHESQADILWETCRTDIPALKAAVTRIRHATTQPERRQPGARTRS